MRLPVKGVLSGQMRKPFGLFPVRKDAPVCALPCGMRRFLRFLFRPEAPSYVD